ncbi:hypothetical protein D3C81_459990 [compost metagenome]
MEELKVLHLGPRMGYWGYFATSRGQILDIDKDPVRIYGSGIVRLRLNGGLGIKSISAHIIIATVFLDNPEGYTHVRFKDGIRTNTAPENLEWYKPERPGKKSGRTEMQSRIIKMKQQGHTSATIEAATGASRQYINNVWRNRYDL